jgi:hypothetical protein
MVEDISLNLTISNAINKIPQLKAKNMSAQSKENIEMFFKLVGVSNYQMDIYSAIHLQNLRNGLEKLSENGQIMHKDQVKYSETMTKTWKEWQELHS